MFTTKNLNYCTESQITKNIHCELKKIEGFGLVKVTSNLRSNIPVSEWGLSLREYVGSDEELELPDKFLVDDFSVMFKSYIGIGNQLVNQLVIFVSRPAFIAFLQKE